ncbi:helix-turn-helix transcriptional regulator [Streptomyces sp. WMMB 322]|uniref:helix-turn-helix transcriptional regulator n=1 Tax=Streptomyces sp. WMMB 322 TaxID=1286821 RepID=UPI0006E1EB7F|nr:helix-turn-helix transcriptional regulator [Streptomyces sp. WMMB 322]SCK40035.1 transcriptional regulator, AraC family [Streptomyces sp. WMMB 322]
MYRERRSLVDGAVVWTHGAVPEGHGRVLPDGCMDLLLWDGALVVAGPDTRAHLFPREAGSRMTGLRLAPGTGPLVFGVPAHELRDRRVPLGDLWPAAAVRVLEERAGEAPQQGRVLEGIAAGRLTGRGPSPNGRAAELLARGRSVAAVAGELGLSERQLHRRCLDAFGYGPKTLARVLRMQDALRLSAGGMPPAEVAAVSGYADQAHLSREVKALAGVTLTELLTQGSGANRSTPLPSGSATTA